MSDYEDIKVRTKAPDVLDATVQSLPGVAAVVIDGSFDGDVCTVRCFGNAGFLRFALTQQGYGEILE